MNHLLYPPYCSHCGEHLQNLKLFCAPCQMFLKLDFLTQRAIYTSYGTLLPLFSKNSTSLSLFNLLKNPQNNFLYDAVASLFYLKIREYPDIGCIKAMGRWPWNLFSRKIANRLTAWMNLKRKSTKGFQVVIADTYKDLESSINKSQDNELLVLVPFL